MARAGKGRGGEGNDVRHCHGSGGRVKNLVWRNGRHGHNEFPIRFGSHGCLGNQPSTFDPPLPPPPAT